MQASYQLSKLSKKYRETFEEVQKVLELNSRVLLVAVIVLVDKKPVRLQLSDTAGQVCYFFLSPHSISFLIWFVDANFIPSSLFPSLKYAFLACSTWNCECNYCLWIFKVIQSKKNLSKAQSSSFELFYIVLFFLLIVLFLRPRWHWECRWCEGGFISHHTL